MVHPSSGHQSRKNFATSFVKNEKNWLRNSDHVEIIVCISPLCLCFEFSSKANKDNSGQYVFVENPLKIAV